MPSVPKIDRLAGIECYCTSFGGIGGSIKQGTDGFRVSELVHDSIAENISPHYDEKHHFPLFILEKEGVDSNHAVIEIERDHHIKLRVMGIKDAKAVTTQYAGTQSAMKNPPAELRTTHARLALHGFMKRPLGKEFLAGNEFRITVYDARLDDMTSFLPMIEKIGNFYGLQRFGSERLVTHMIGREIVKRNFGRAIELLLSYTTEHDTPTSQEIRRLSGDPKNYSRLLNTLPKGMDLERQVIAALLRGKENISALRAVPITIRRLFVHAYQAFIFNRCLSTAILGGEDILRAQAGDLCFEMEDRTTFGRIVKFENARVNQPVVPAIRMAGFSFQPGRGRFETITKDILGQEGVIAKDFYIKEMQELSNQGGFRQAPLWCLDFAYSRGPPLSVTFRLPKGSYATTLLRELIKPLDPIASGF